MNTTCQNCGTPGMDLFYEAKGIPVHSCLMFDTRRTALDYPTRDLSLGFCRTCGFISNVIFDPGVHEYSSRYEDQQSFSPRFRAFQTDLIGRLIERYDVRDKDVLEIGCGKGDFLVELCRAGGNRGVGIDPACIPDRVEGDGASRVRFIDDFYSESYSGIPCDFLCCRHTLEHIHTTREFVRTVRGALGDRTEVTVFFEVPDVARVLREQAFWDVYYEHCSYFTLGSLARVFRQSCFDVVELDADYDDQYLLLVARPVDGPTDPSLPDEDDLDALARDVETFRVEVQARLEAWRTRLRGLKQQGKRVAIWGSGSKCVSFLSTLGVGEEVAVVVDINPHRHGRFLPGSGMEVVAPESLQAHRPDVVLVMNPIYCDEIRRQLHKMGVSTELVPV